LKRAYSNKTVFEGKAKTSLDNLYRILCDFNENKVSDLPGPLMRVNFERVGKLGELSEQWITLGWVRQVPRADGSFEFRAKVTSVLDDDDTGKLGIGEVIFGHFTPIPVLDGMETLVRAVCDLPGYDWAIGYFEATHQHLKKVCDLNETNEEQAAHPGAAVTAESGPASPAHDAPKVASEFTPPPDEIGRGYYPSYSQTIAQAVIIALPKARAEWEAKTTVKVWGPGFIGPHVPLAAEHTGKILNAFRDWAIKNRWPETVNGVPLPTDKRKGQGRRKS
jgi:hypothetical protein